MDQADQAARDREHVGRFFRALGWCGVLLLVGLGLWQLYPPVLIAFGVGVLGWLFLGVVWEATR